ncbi:hypothetical protein Vretimale_13826, partial [Volvox reticuliferus]
TPAPAAKAAAAVTLAPAAAKPAAAAKSANVTTLVAQSAQQAVNTTVPQTNIVMEVLNFTGISKQLQNGMAATIFAPDDAAFASMAKKMKFAGGIQDLLKIPELYNITLLHIVPGVALKSSDVSLGKAVTLPSLLGDKLMVAKTGTIGGLQVRVADPVANGMWADVVKADVPFPHNKKAVMHVISAIL